MKGILLTFGGEGEDDGRGHRISEVFLLFRNLALSCYLDSAEFISRYTRSLFWFVFKFSLNFSGGLMGNVIIASAER